MENLQKEFQNETQYMVMLLFNCYKNNDLKIITELDIHRTMYIISTIYPYGTQKIADEFSKKSVDFRYNNFEFGSTLLGTPYSYEIQKAIEYLLKNEYIIFAKSYRGYLTLNIDKPIDLAYNIYPDVDVFSWIIDALCYEIQGESCDTTYSLKQYCEYDDIFKNYYHTIKEKYNTKMLNDSNYRYSILFSNGEFVQTQNKDGLNNTIDTLNKIRETKKLSNYNFKELIDLYFIGVFEKIRQDRIKTSYINDINVPENTKEITKQQAQYILKNKINIDLFYQNCFGWQPFNINNYFTSYIENHKVVIKSVDYDYYFGDEDVPNTLIISNEQFNYLVNNRIAVVVFFLRNNMWQETIAKNEVLDSFEECELRIAIHDYEHYFGDEY